MRRVVALLFLLVIVVGCSHEPPAYESHYTPPPPPPKTSAVAVIGDSYTGGSNEGGTREHGWPALVTTQLDRQGVPVRFDVGAVGGSGYVNRGPKNRVFADEVPDVVHPGDRLVVFFGSRNDRGIDPAELGRAVQQALGSAKAIAPSAGLLVIGPPWVEGEPTPSILNVRDALRTEAEAAGATFVDPIAEGWFAGQPNLIGTDNVHPNDAGHVYMADKIAPVIAAQLQQPATP
ncbi:MAG: SGNH/GDSL hydrolase family protein [Actinomycetota bacterium]